MEHDKLGFYLGVARTVQKLKEVRANTLIDAEGEDTLMAMLWRIQKLLGESTNDTGLAGLRPFSRLQLFQQPLFDFYQALNTSLGDDDNPLHDVALGRVKQRELQDLIGELEQVFREEVETRVVFISPDRLSLLEYSSPNEFLHSEIDKQHFQFLPRITQQGFEDAGRCLVYGLPGAAISMALQAVEAAIRFYYIRHGGPSKQSRPDEVPEWANMIDWLNRQQPSLLPGNEVERRRCYAMLDRLRYSYRNTVAHGRALFETSKSEENLARGEEVFRECLASALFLSAETSRRSQLNLHIRAHPVLSFDSAVAIYLYSWNPELPPFAPRMVQFDDAVSDGEIIDETVIPTLHWPKLIRATMTESLSHVVRKCFRMQPNSAATIDPLVGFVDKCIQGGFNTRFDSQSPREEDVSLLDLFRGIKLHLEDVRKQEGDAEPKIDPQQLLIETWKMLDEFVESSLSPEGSSLVTDLNMQPVFNTLCRVRSFAPAPTTNA